MRISSNINNYNIKDSNSRKIKKQISNKGAIDSAFNALNAGFHFLDKTAMFQVSFLDIVSSIAPRTIVDLGTGMAAALETFRRESAGLIINCLIPGVIVKGVAGLLPKSDVLKGTKPVSSWANAETIDKLKNVYNNAQISGATDTTREYVTQSLNSIKGLKNNTWTQYSNYVNRPEYQDAITKLTKAVSEESKKKRKKLLNEAQNKLVGLTKAENVLKFNDKACANLSDTLRDIVDMGEKFNTVKETTVKNLLPNELSSDVNNKISSALNKYSTDLKKFVNRKSLIGLALVLGLGFSFQKINRAITKKQFKTDGAPIYKDFGQDGVQKKEMTPKEKKRFAIKKALAFLSMYGLAGLSMMKKPTLGMFQFSGPFPSINQCRVISATTFASRMLAAEDENELRESIVRDMATFSSLYFLGDYVKKAAASGFEALSKSKTGSKLIKEKVVLLNRSKEIAKPIFNANASTKEKIAKNISYRAKQFGNWVKNTELKTAAEVSGTKARNLRNLCRVADIAFSLLMLGIVIPKYNRHVTNKKIMSAQNQSDLNNKNQIYKNSMPDIFKSMV